MRRTRLSIIWVHIHLYWNVHIDREAKRGMGWVEGGMQLNIGLRYVACQQVISDAIKQACSNR